MAREVIRGLDVVRIGDEAGATRAKRRFYRRIARI
jgi:hypothetical protein